MFSIGPNAIPGSGTPTRRELMTSQDETSVRELQAADPSGQPTGRPTAGVHPSSTGGGGSGGGVAVPHYIKYHAIISDTGRIHFSYSAYSDDQCKMEQFTRVLIQESDSIYPDSCAVYPDTNHGMTYMSVRLASTATLESELNSLNVANLAVIK